VRAALGEAEPGVDEDARPRHAGGQRRVDPLAQLSLHLTHYVVMHSRGPSADMRRRAHYSDVVGEVVDELGRRLDSVYAAGVRPGQVVVDPGLGFAKHARHNWELLARLDRLTALGRPVLVGASRKSFLGALTGRAVDDREVATAAANTAAILGGARIVRVHDVRAQKDAIAVADAIVRARGGAAAGRAAS
jgi:dihydropteroate synthase